MAIGKTIKAWRERRDWEQGDLVGRVPGLSQAALSALEIRDSARTKFQAGIAKAFGATVDQLVNGTDPLDEQERLASLSEDAQTVGAAWQQVRAPENRDRITYQLLELAVLSVPADSIWRDRILQLHKTVARRLRKAPASGPRKSKAKGMIETQ